MMATKTYKKEKDHGTDISFENEVKKMNEGLKKHKDLDFSGLEKEIDRLSEERDNLLVINKGHKDLNGELQTKLSKKEQEVVALYENVKIKDKIITKLKDRIQEIIKQLVHLCKS